MEPLKWKKNTGEIPVSADTEVAVKFRDGGIGLQKAGYYEWDIGSDNNVTGDIMVWMFRSDYDIEMNKPTQRLDEGLDPRVTGVVDIPDPGAHYRFIYKGIKLDPFRICNVYGITDLGQGTLVKKALRLGTSIKDRKQDLLDIISAAERMLEIIKEDKK